MQAKSPRCTKNNGSERERETQGQRKGGIKSAISFFRNQRSSNCAMAAARGAALVTTNCPPGRHWTTTTGPGAKRIAYGGHVESRVFHPDALTSCAGLHKVLLILFQKGWLEDGTKLYFSELLLRNFASRGRSLQFFTVDGDSRSIELRSEVKKSWGTL